MKLKERQNDARVRGVWNPSARALDPDFFPRFSPSLSESSVMASSPESSSPFEYLVTLPLQGSSRVLTSQRAGNTISKDKIANPLGFPFETDSMMNSTRT